MKKEERGESRASKVGRLNSGSQKPRTQSITFASFHTYMTHQLGLAEISDWSASRACSASHVDPNPA